MKTFYLTTALAFVLILAGCEKEDISTASANQELSASQVQQEDSISRGYTDTLRLVIGNSQAKLWNSCIIFRADDDPVAIRHTVESYNELYWNKNGFKDDVKVISDARPGDENYNEGRWHLNTLKAGVDPAKYSGACSIQSLDRNDFISEDIYFSCELVPVIR